MSQDGALRRSALRLLVRADQHNWIHQTSWFGEPILNLPQDMFALQEIIFSTRPEFIVEVGVAWGGSLLFYSTLLESLGGGKIVGIDIYIPEDLKERIGAFGKVSERIRLVEGSSVDASTIEEVRAIIGKSKRGMIVLDSNHTHEHVLRELRLYSQLIGKGCYIVCGDTIIDEIPKQRHRPRAWGPGNNPRTAVDQFLRENKSFRVDERIENRLLLSCNPGGYLLKCKA